jgi:hypothetical protein
VEELALPSSMTNGIMVGKSSKYLALFMMEYQAVCPLGKDDFKKSRYGNFPHMLKLSKQTHRCLMGPLNPLKEVQKGSMLNRTRVVKQNIETENSV